MLEKKVKNKREKFPKAISTQLHRLAVYIEKNIALAVEQREADYLELEQEVVNFTKEYGLNSTEFYEAMEGLAIAVKIHKQQFEENYGELRTIVKKLFHNAQDNFTVSDLHVPGKLDTDRHEFLLRALKEGDRLFMEQGQELFPPSILEVVARCTERYRLDRIKFYHRVNIRVWEPLKKQAKKRSSTQNDESEMKDKLLNPRKERTFFKIYTLLANIRLRRNDKKTGFTI